MSEQNNLPQNTAKAIGQDGKEIQPTDQPGTIEVIAQFRAFALTHGLELPEKLIDDGKIHRFALPGDMPPVKNGAYILYPMTPNRIPSGNIRDFRGDDPAQIWVYKTSHTQPPIDEYDRLPTTLDPDGGARDDDMPPSYFGVPDDDMPPSYFGVPDDDIGREKTAPTSKAPTPAKVAGQQTGQTTSSLNKFSLSGKSTEMRTKMLDDKFVLHRIAILGQITAIYAMPGTGKTLLVLFLLIEAIKSSTINPADIFYINADDNYKGLVQKLELAEQYGFHMIAPGHNGFKANELKDHMAEMVKSDTARGVVIVLDTLKKFTDLMDKKTASGFMRSAREFVSSGGTLILLAHTNKKRDDSGKAIFGGTSDVVDDCDCMFILDEVGITNGVKRVLFENKKSRGDVAGRLAFDYSPAERQAYRALLNSIKMVDLDEEQQAEMKAAVANDIAQDTAAINAIKAVMAHGVNAKTQLVSTARALAKVGRPRLEAVLIKYAGTKHSDTCFWRVDSGDNNAILYYPLEPENYTEEDYKLASDGE